MENSVAGAAVNRVVAYIDILGFSALVTRTLSGDDATLTRVYERLRMLSGYADLTNQGPFGSRDLTPYAQATAFSDCIVISDINNGSGIRQVLSNVAMVAGFLLRDGILCRGGIAAGKTIHDDRVLLGEGLIEAYKIEQQLAVYPRIVVCDKLVGRAGVLDVPRIPRLKRDADGLWFIDLFWQLYRIEGDPASLLTSWLPERVFDIDQFRRVRDFIIRSLSQTRDDLRLWMKHRWLASRFNDAILEYVPGQIEAIDV